MILIDPITINASQMSSATINRLTLTTGSKPDLLSKPMCEFAHFLSNSRRNHHTGERHGSRVSDFRPTQGLNEFRCTVITKPVPEGLSSRIFPFREITQIRLNRFCPRRGIHTSAVERDTGRLHERPEHRSSKRSLSNDCFSLWRTICKKAHRQKQTAGQRENTFQHITSSKIENRAAMQTAPRQQRKRPAGHREATPGGDLNTGTIRQSTYRYRLQP